MRSALVLGLVVSSAVPLRASATEPHPATDPFPALSAIVPADPAAPGGPDLRARVYVKDLDHLARIVSSDPELGARARDLAARQKRAAGITIGGFVLSGALVGLGGALWASDLDTDLDSDTFGEHTSSRGPTLMVAGGATLLATTVYVVTRAARGGDLVDLVNDWNVRHPAEPLEIVGYPSAGHGHHGPH